MESFLSEYDSGDEAAEGSIVQVKCEATSCGRKPRRIDYSRLPVSRPLVTSTTITCTRPQTRELEPDASAFDAKLNADASSCGDHGSPLGKGDHQDDDKSSDLGDEALASCAPSTAGLTAPWLPPPKRLPVKKNLGAVEAKYVEAGGAFADEVFIDFGKAGRPSERPRAVAASTTWLLEAPRAPEIEEPAGRDVSDQLLRHPMFRGGVQRVADGPSEADIQQLRGARGGLVHIDQDAVRDPTWCLHNRMTGGPGLHPGEKVPMEVSQYSSDEWSKTTHADPSRTQKRKHQINWLAHEAIEKEAEMLDRAASGRDIKSKSLMKYGW